MTSQMVGFIVGIFVGAVVGIIILALANASQLDEITDATTVVQEEKVCDITPEMARLGLNVVKDYTQTVDCESCTFKKDCDRNTTTICEFFEK